MITAVTIKYSDFIPLTDSHEFVFILFCESKDGRIYNTEDFGTMSELAEKYKIEYNFFDWDTAKFKGRRCEISLRIFRRPKFVRFISYYASGAEIAV